MSECRRGKLEVPGVAVGGASPFPAMRDLLHGELRAEIDEDDGLFLGYGLDTNALPYSLQDRYDGEMRPLTFATVELENDRLHAVFLPEVGGRLWSLYDKIEGRNLVHRNPVFQPRNFAIRDAWVAGGVEWNIGRRGHDVRTCAPLFAAGLHTDDGTPVLRFYEFSRTHGAVYQMDFFLPDGSEFLFSRVRIVNPLWCVIPMYWWSNIAVAQYDDERIIVPADTAFANHYINDATHTLTIWPLPEAHGIDVTYPANHVRSKDFFYRIPDGVRPYECVFRRDGHGLAHMSTSRLKGRKLFVWGEHPGGLHWQKRLGPQKYFEIQAGLARTQMECLPMPPVTAWEWMEAYGPASGDPAALFGDWGAARRETERDLDRRLPPERLEAMLHATKPMARRPAEELWHRGSGWGALENRTRPSPMTDHLDFGEPGPKQRPWRLLLETGRLGDDDPTSWMTTPEWQERLRQAAAGPDAANWRVWLHLAVGEHQRKEYERALARCERSLELAVTAWGLHAKANILRSDGRLSEAAVAMRQALLLRPDDPSLAKEAGRLLLEARAFATLVEAWEALPEAVAGLPLIRFFRAAALVELGRWREAEALLLEDGVLRIPDIREGENSLSALYLAIQAAKAAETGEPFDKATAPIPPEFDLRMNEGEKPQPCSSPP